MAFLRLLLCGCDLALLDEPFVGLDRDLRDILVAMLVEKSSGRAWRVYW
ncbi:ABC transporter ATP-binding protein [Neisseria gonorrhoeae]|uniref:ABC transporter ATP-binding protein n=1 Tax=Neisseria gonorrhoeae TaxID=485 RepID=A0A378VVZ4_NEIGO|nr:ABC transporter ATP-binding protein [Neisseria gonorrhoeae]